MANGRDNEVKQTEEEKIVSVRFSLGSKLREDVRKKFNIDNKQYVEIRVTNSEPMITIEKVDSPSSKVSKVLQEHNIIINDL